MSGARTAGGVLAIIGGAGFLAGALFIPFSIFGPSFPLQLIIALIIGALALVGGIIGMTSSKNAGGGLSLAAGIAACAIGVIYFIFHITIFAIHDFALLESFFPFDYLVFGLTIEAVLILIGGILLLASSDL